MQKSWNLSQVFCFLFDDYFLNDNSDSNVFCADDEETMKKLRENSKQAQKILEKKNEEKKKKMEMLMEVLL